jgi:hypothetical protein
MVTMFAKNVSEAEAKEWEKNHKKRRRKETKEKA